VTTKKNPPSEEESSECSEAEEVTVSAKIPVRKKSPAPTKKKNANPAKKAQGGKEAKPVSYRCTLTESQAEYSEHLCTISRCNGGVYLCASGLVQLAQDAVIFSTEWSRSYDGNEAGGGRFAFHAWDGDRGIEAVTEGVAGSRCITEKYSLCDVWVEHATSQPQLMVTHPIPG